MTLSFWSTRESYEVITRQYSTNTSVEATADRRIAECMVFKVGASAAICISESGKCLA
jgi:hypothetical protein